MTLRTSAARALCGGTAAVVRPLGPVVSAQASNATFKQAIRAAGPTITSDEGAIVSVLGQVERSKDPAPVRFAMAHENSDLAALKGAVAAQSASSASGKRGKSAFLRGVSLIIKSYRQLDKVLARGNSGTSTARTELRKSLKNASKGRAQIQLAGTLLT